MSSRRTDATDGSDGPRDQSLFGVAGGDIRIGGDILTRAAVSDDFANASGQYFDNDAGRFSRPHPDGLDDRKSAEVVQAIEAILA